MQRHITAAAQELSDICLRSADFFREIGFLNLLFLHQRGNQFRRFKRKRFLFEDTVSARIFDEFLKFSSRLLHNTFPLRPIMRALFSPVFAP